MTYFKDFLKGKDKSDTKILLKSKKSLKKHKKWVKKISAERAKVIKSISKIKQELIKEAGGKICVFCKKEFRQIDLCHIIRQSDSKKLRTDKKNCFLGCRKHHNIFDSNDFDKIIQLPNIGGILIRMKEVDKKYYYRFIN